MTLRQAFASLALSLTGLLVGVVVLLRRRQWFWERVG